MTQKPRENENKQLETTSVLNEEKYDTVSQSQSGLWCPNCGSVLEGRKCKLFCLTPGCGYLVTCSEW